MYHVELRQFPHNFCRFNLTERELRELILDAWAREEWVELGERKWNPHQANLTVLEGPQLPLEQLSMGRGWRNAKRGGQDVTQQMLTAARATPAGGITPAGATLGGVALAGTTQAGATQAAGSESDIQLHGDSLGLEMLSRLSGDTVPIALVWRLAHERYPDRSVSDCLRLAELAVRSLSETGLIVLLVGEDGDEEPEILERGESLERALGEVDSWGSAGEPGTVLMRRA